MYSDVFSFFFLECYQNSRQILYFSVLKVLRNSDKIPSTFDFKMAKFNFKTQTIEKSLTIFEKLFTILFLTELLNLERCKGASIF